uniref:Uncharacterized protein n=1 Tax=Ananas comosus var. bracteatus TaxID=296719 RepID=A0A6V7Q9E8_ANACO|nr:unnamed protein product [Ananas comosus var. bracteatus]
MPTSYLAYSPQARLLSHFLSFFFSFLFHFFSTELTTKPPSSTPRTPPISPTSPTRPLPARSIAGSLAPSLTSQDTSSKHLPNSSSQFSSTLSSIRRFPKSVCFSFPDAWNYCHSNWFLLA